MPPAPLPPCIQALKYFERKAVRPETANESERAYVPKHIIKEYFKDENILKSIFLCPCFECTSDSGAEHDEDREPHWAKEKLQGDYALIYALLIWIRRPGLIRTFRRHGLRLKDEATPTYLERSSFDVLKKEDLDAEDLDFVVSQILSTQYSFLVRTLEPDKELIKISHRELLPLREDRETKGEGTFAQVRCFEFQFEEYRSKEFGEVSRWKFLSTRLMIYIFRSKDLPAKFPRQATKNLMT
jgi:hypothetical protein